MSLVSIFAGLVSPVTNYLGKRSDNKTAVKKQTIKRLMDSDDALATWEQIQAEGSKHSWKDEYWTVLLSVPVILCFIPGAVNYVTMGFFALSQMPEYYQYWLGVAILSSFGIRAFKR